jgi:hypothetical protein
LNEQRNYYICKLEMLHTQTHKIKQNLSIFIAWGMLHAMAESPGVMLLRGQYQHFKKDHAKKNM